MIHRLATALLALGLAGGYVFDRMPARPEVRRGPWRVLEADFHAHTSFSDGSLSPFGLTRQAERRSLDVLGVTEHNTVWPARVARLWSRATGGPSILVGQEITTSRFHVVALGLAETVSPNQDLAAVLRDVHAQGGFAIAAHPVKRYWPALLPVRDRLDGSEVMHPLAYASSSMPASWRWSDMLAFHDEADPPLAAIGSSDYHWGTHLGWCRTLVFARDAGDDAVMEALRAHRTVVVDPTGALHGDAAARALLAAEPYTPRAVDYSYRGTGLADRLLRGLGWLGVLGLVAFERRRTPREVA